MRSLMVDRFRAHWPEWLLVSGFVLIFAVLSAYPVTDGDFFWHIHSGQRILADGQLPEHDPFSFTTARFVAEQPADPRISAILQQYWLAQIALYQLHALAGSSGIVVLRVLVFAAILTILYLWGRRRAPWPVSAAFTILTASLLLDYPTERPQLFSFLLAPVVLFLLERLRDEERSRQGAVAVMLPLLMLLWGNLHGGYLLGVGFCLIYLAGHVCRALRGKRFDRRYAAVLLLASGLAFVNPCGFDIVHVLGSTDRNYLSSVYETLSPLTAFRHGDHYWAYWLGVLLLATALVVRRGHGGFEHVVVLGGVLLLSLTGLRYMIFLLLCFPLGVGTYAHLGRKRAFVALAVALVVFFANADFSRAGQFGVSDRFPRQAAGFLRDRLPGKNLYGHYDWGGYLGFISPKSRVFIDGRGLVPAVVREYTAIKEADNYHERLHRFGVEAIVMPGFGARGGKLFPLIRALYGDDRWQLVYADEVALVFVPADALHSPALTALDKREIFHHVIRRADRLLAAANRSERLALLQTRAESQMLLGDYQGARASGRAMLAIDAGNGFAARLLATLERF